MKNIKVALAQMNPTVGNYRANAEKIIKYIKEADEKGANLIVFPELALSGYPVWDLATKLRFVQDGLKELKKIITATKKCEVVVALGLIDRNKKKNEKNYNALALFQSGKLIGIHHKTLLPNYDVFLERIFFEPAEKTKLFKVLGLKLGASICEDLWDEAYEAKPLQDLKQKGAELVINISSSPFYGGVDRIRRELIKMQAKKYRFPIIYVNQVGGQDDLVFDGRSLIANAEGDIVFQAPIFEEGLFYYDMGSKQKVSVRKKSFEEEAYHALCLGVRDYCKKNNFKNVVLGLSGGIDSALTAVIAADALGPENVTGITMPSRFSSKGSWADSEKLAAALKIEFRKYPIKDKYDYMLKAFCAQQPEPQKMNMMKSHIATENLQARLRGLELMFVSNFEGYLLLTTGNKSELAVGYCTLYGDMCGGLSVLGDVYKTDVYKLARWRNKQGAVIPSVILTKPPSAELRPNQKDQDSLPDYEILDSILFDYIEKNMTRDQIINKLAKRKIPKKTVVDVIRKVDHNEYKRRQLPPSIRVSSKAWFGRRMPITNQYSG